MPRSPGTPSPGIQPSAGTQPSAAEAETRLAPSPDPVAVVLRPRLGFRIAGPLVGAFALVLLLAGWWWGVLLLPPAIALLVASLERVELLPTAVRRRSWSGWAEPVPLERVVAFRLRRAPLRGLKLLRHGYRIGRWYSVPLTLRLVTTDSTVLELRVACWAGWRALARYVAAQPTVHLDGKTRERLTRYADG